MIKKIPVAMLKPGMFIHDLDASWMTHDFVRTRFAVDNGEIVSKIVRSGLKQIYIDTSKGADVHDAPSITQVQEQVESQVATIATPPLPSLPSKQITTQEELKRARSIVTEANVIMTHLMHDVRLGKQVEVEALMPIADEMVSSIFRNPDALISLSRMKNKDDYTFMHSVSVAGLLITFARHEGFSHAQIREIAIGGLLHDIGKMSTPDTILNKNGKLTDEEFAIMKDHVVQSRLILEKIPGFSSMALNVAAQHHERFDGSGYPLGLKGDAISSIGQMSSIVDVYDALTSERIYKDAWEPTFVLKKLIEWSQHHFKTEQVHSFIRCLGIYPVGTLVEMESGRIGIVIEQHHSNLLHPTVRFIYNRSTRRYTEPRVIELEREQSDTIKRAVSPLEFGIDLNAFN